MKAWAIMLYEGAVYLHEGLNYLAERPGLGKLAPPSQDDRGRILHAADRRREDRGAGRDERRRRRRKRNSSHRPTGLQPQLPTMLPATTSRSAWGDIRVISQTTGYKIIRRSTHEVLGFGLVHTAGTGLGDSGLLADPTLKSWSSG